jgi:hypothetical protein
MKIINSNCWRLTTFSGQDEVGAKDIFIIIFILWV